METRNSATDSDPPLCVLGTSHRHAGLICTRTFSRIARSTLPDHASSTSCQMMKCAQLYEVFFLEPRNGAIFHAQCNKAAFDRLQGPLGHKRIGRWRDRAFGFVPRKGLFVERKTNKRRLNSGGEETKQQTKSARKVQGSRVREE